jgi:hypothetical protein
MELSPWLLRLENRLGRWAVPQVIKGLVLLNILTYVLGLFEPGFGSMLTFDTTLVRAGEFWRVATFLFVPGYGGGSRELLFFAVYMYFTWFIGGGVEEAWGAFPVNFYLAVSVACLAVAGLWLYPGVTLPNIFIFQSLLFAFATLYPNLPIGLFPFPVQFPVKYLAYFSAGLTLLTVLRHPALLPLVLASNAGYLLYAGPAFVRDWRRRADSKRRLKKFRGEE